ncbi:MAG: pyridoxamine 5'-phosphate oxidase family protein [Acidimicrobiia bacterium]|nr:pyridoxamine 5'-phosphate oxidase family protein [Acidimicrobiia bacterium]
MSMQVDVAALGEALAEYGFAYLVTVGDSGRVHVLAVTPVLEGAGELVVGGVGHHSQDNALARPDVTLVWPPTEDGGFSLIVDGVATVDGETITVAPTKAIKHRPAPAPGPDGQRAGSDCQPVA